MKIGAYKRSPDGAEIEHMASPRGLTFKAEGSEPGLFEGYLSVWGVEDYYGETVDRGAFSDSIAEWNKSGDKMPLLWQHMSSEPIGYWENLAEDDYGLRAVGRILVDAGQLEARAWAHVKSGSMRGLSIGYWLTSWEVTDDEFHITGVDLREGSLVTFPANRDAVIDQAKAMIVGVRKSIAAGEPLSERQLEFVLRDCVGMTRRAAEAVVNGQYKPFLRREADGLDGADLNIREINLPD